MDLPQLPILDLVVVVLAISTQLEPMELVAQVVLVLSFSVTAIQIVTHMT